MKLILIPSLLALLGSQFMSACNDLCSDEIVSETQSPSGRYIATLMVRDCGATTNFASQISLRNSAEEYRPEEGVIAIFDGRVVAVTWQNERLSIDYGDAERFRTDTEWNDITIDYH